MTSASKDMISGLASADVKLAGDVYVKGHVSEQLTMKAGGAVTIDGISASASIEAGGALCVTGGIKGGDTAHYRARGDVRARYVDNATIDTDGNVMITTEVLNSRIICGGRLIVRNGGLVAGHATATCGVRCRVLGSPHNGAKTIVEVGIDAALQADAAAALKEIQAKQARSAKLRESVAPLMLHQKRLSAEQKEKATELLFEAEELEAAVTRLLETMRPRIESLDSRINPCIRVMEMLHAPVIIRMPGMEAQIQNDLEGPIWIVIGGRGRTPFVTVTRQGRVIESLETRLEPDKVIPILRQLLAASPHSHAAAA